MAPSNVLYLAADASDTRLLASRIQRYAKVLDEEPGILTRGGVVERIEFESVVIDVVPSQRMARLHGKNYDRAFMNGRVPENAAMFARSRARQRGDIPMWLEAFMITQARAEE